jgi:modulator of FtsH protease HflK
VAGSAAGRAGVDALIEDVAASALSSAITAMQVDAVLTVERIAIQQKVRDGVQAWFDRQPPGRQAGVRVTSVSLEGVSPPQEVAEAFRDVTSARADSQRTVNEAESYANVLSEQSKGEAERISLDAAGFAGEATEKAHGDADRFVRVAAEVAIHRELTVRRLVLETMEEVLPRLKKIVLDGHSGKSLDLGLMEEEP